MFITLLRIWQNSRRLLQDVQDFLPRNVVQSIEVVRRLPEKRRECLRSILRIRANTRSTGTVHTPAEQTVNIPETSRYHPDKRDNGTWRRGEILLHANNCGHTFTEVLEIPTALTWNVRSISAAKAYHITTTRKRRRAPQDLRLVYVPPPLATMVSRVCPGRCSGKA